MMSFLGFEQTRVDVHPHRVMTILKVIREICVGHQMEPTELHEGLLLVPRNRLGPFMSLRTQFIALIVSRNYYPFSPELRRVWTILSAAC